jgi:hypothetical protein
MGGAGDSSATFRDPPNASEPGRSLALRCNVSRFNDVTRQRCNIRFKCQRTTRLSLFTKFRKQQSEIGNFTPPPPGGPRYYALPGVTKRYGGVGEKAESCRPCARAALSGMGSATDSVAAFGVPPKASGSHCKLQFINFSLLFRPVKLFRPSS